MELFEFTRENLMKFHQKVLRIKLNQTAFLFQILLTIMYYHIQISMDTV